MEENPPTQPIQTPTPQPVVQPPQMPIKPKKAWKKWVLIIIVLLLLFSLPLGGYLVLNQLSINPKPSKVVIQNIKPTLTPNPTANWKTFNFKTLKVKYPQSWKETEGGSGLWSNDKPNIYFTTHTYINYDLSTGKPYNDIKNTGIENNEKNLTPIIIDGINGIKTYKLNNEFISNVKKSKTIWIRFFSRDKSVMYFLSISNIADSKQENLINKILANIKVSNSPVNQFSDWQQYENSKYDFTFKYPKHLSINDASNSIDFSNEVFDNIPLITVKGYTVNPSLYKQCTDDIKYPCISSIEKMILDMKEVNIFGISLGIDNGFLILQLENPQLEIKMFTAGGGLTEILKGILSTFKFTN